jgi:hypothetical protein
MTFVSQYSRVPHNYWSNNANLEQSWDVVAKELDVKTVSGWNSVISVINMQQQGIMGLVSTRCTHIPVLSFFFFIDSK